MIKDGEIEYIKNLAKKLQIENDQLKAKLKKAIFADGYGPGNEFFKNARTCPVCGGASNHLSTRINVNRYVTRKWTCNDCGKTFKTVEIYGGQ